MPTFLGLHDPHTLRPRPIEVIGAVARGAQSDLHCSTAINQSFLHGAPERSAVCYSLTEHLVVNVRMCIDVHQTDGAVLAMHGT